MAFSSNTVIADERLAPPHPASTAAARFASGCPRALAILLNSFQNADSRGVLVPATLSECLTIIAKAPRWDSIGNDGWLPPARAHRGGLFPTPVRVRPRRARHARGLLAGTAQINDFSHQLFLRKASIETTLGSPFCGFAAAPSALAASLAFLGCLAGLASGKGGA